VSANETDERDSGSDEPFLRALNARVNSIRVDHPEIHGADIDLLFFAYLLEASRFGLFSYGPITIDVATVEDRYLRSLKPKRTDQPHRPADSYIDFFKRLGEELVRAKTRRPSELTYLLAFMRTNEGLPAQVFGELGTSPESVEAFAREQASPGGSSEFLSPEDIARRLDVNVQTVRAWIRSGKLPASRLAGGRILRVRESDLCAILEPVDPDDFA
jgi:excisionase family DNA binding protein